MTFVIFVNQLKKIELLKYTLSDASLTRAHRQQ